MHTHLQVELYDMMNAVYKDESDEKDNMRK